MEVQKQIEFLLENQAKHDTQIGKLIDLHKKWSMASIAW